MRRALILGLSAGAVFTAVVLVLIVLIVHSGHSEEAVSPEPSVTSLSPADRCVQVVQRVLVRYGQDAKTSSMPAWILPEERDSMTDLEYAAYSQVSTDYDQMVNPYGQNVAILPAISQVLPTIRQTCSRAS